MLKKKRRPLLRAEEEEDEEQQSNAQWQRAFEFAAGERRKHICKSQVQNLDFAFLFQEFIRDSRERLSTLFTVCPVLARRHACGEAPRHR